MIRKGYAHTPSGQVHFRRVDGPGVPVVLFHRTPVDSSCFDAMLALLAGKRAAIALDTPGFGQSFKPSGSPTTSDYAAWFLAALDQLGILAFHLCAHHTGTHFATELAVLAPARTRSLMLSGVLYAKANERAARRARIGAAPAMDEYGQYLMTTWSVIKSLFARFDPVLVHTELVAALACPEGRDQAFDAILDQDFASVLTRVRCPVAIVQAVDDPLDAMLDDVRTDFPAIGISTLPPCGMAAPELQADAYTETLLRFLESADALQPHPSPESPSMTDRRIQLIRSGERFYPELVRSKRPAPGEGEVLIRVHAVSINRRDIMIMRNQGYPLGDANGFTPLSDAAGEVVALGQNVSHLSIGDRVCSTMFQNWQEGRFSLAAMVSALGMGGTGVAADHVVLSARGVTPIPPAWTYEQAASLPCAGVTAWTSLFNHGGVRPGDWVLVLGTGGVALFALQIAIAAGARVIILSSSDEKLARARELGAHATVNYVQHPEWDIAVREATGGVDHVIELGGTGTLQRSLASLAPGGHLALVGALDGFGGEIAAAGLIIGAQRISGISVGSHADQIALIDFLGRHPIRPEIDSVFEFEDIASAYARAESGAFGKVVVRLVS